MAPLISGHWEAPPDAALTLSKGYQAVLWLRKLSQRHERTQSGKPMMARAPRAQTNLMAHQHKYNMSRGDLPSTPTWGTAMARSCCKISSGFSWAPAALCGASQGIKSKLLSGGAFLSSNSAWGQKGFQDQHKCINIYTHTPLYSQHYIIPSTTSLTGFSLMSESEKKIAFRSK